MAIANAQCVCAKCGKPFAIRKNLYNSAAARSFEAWAEENASTCGDCYAAAKRAAADAAYSAKLDKLHITLPEIIGVSEKQIGYAAALRDQFMRKHISEIEELIKTESAFHAQPGNRTLRKWWRPYYMKIAQERGMSKSEAVSDFLKRHLESLESNPICAAWIAVRTSESAKAIIDSLKGVEP